MQKSILGFYSDFSWSISILHFRKFGHCVVLFFNVLMNNILTPNGPPSCNSVKHKQCSQLSVKTFVWMHTLKGCRVLFLTRVRKWRVNTFGIYYWSRN